MRATDEQKLEMIFSIDRWTAVVKGSSYERELKMMRLRYIYKDISLVEMLKDRKFLCDMRDALYYFENKMRTTSPECSSLVSEDLP